jgi:hypothetical protein
LILARGWCSLHYARWRRTGDPMPEQPVQRHGAPIEERIESLIDKSGPGGCWLWTGHGRGKFGYGGIKIGSRGHYAHRVVYELLVGPVPKGLELDHLCRVPRCVNPAHLEPVTRRENQMRGEAFVSANARKTHCPQGHPYDEANTYINRASGGRVCRACNNDHQRRYQARKKQKQSG